jgi:hypothetical protein
MALKRLGKRRARENIRFIVKGIERGFGYYY